MHENLYSKFDSKQLSWYHKRCGSCRCHKTRGSTESDIEVWTTSRSTIENSNGSNFSLWHSNWSSHNITWNHNSKGWLWKLRWLRESNSCYTFCCINNNLTFWVISERFVGLLDWFVILLTLYWCEFAWTDSRWYHLWFAVCINI